MQKNARYGHSSAIENPKTENMSNKLIAFRLKKEGKSYGVIAKILRISKSTAFAYVQEMNTASANLKEKKGAALLNPIPKVNTSSATLQQQLGQISKEHAINTKQLDELETPILEPLRLKEFTGDELIQKEFECLAFEGKFLELIGKPSRVFSGIIWGMPKGGKSNFALRFADYLQEYFGQVLYVAAEEGESVTLQEKFKDIDGSKVTVIETRDRDKIRAFLQQRQEFGFIFIDSINNAGIDNDFLELLKEENKNRSFISIVQATKSGKFKGDQALTHNCDFIITVDKGVASHQGRFNIASEINIFEDGALYQKNPVQQTKDWEKQKIIQGEQDKISTNSLKENRPEEPGAEQEQRKYILPTLEEFQKKFAERRLQGLGNQSTRPQNSQAVIKRAIEQLPPLNAEQAGKLLLGIGAGLLFIGIYEYYQDYQNKKIS